MSVKYRNRSEAGQVLADLLADYAHRKDVIILALPRGGVPVAYEIAVKNGLRLDVFIVRKLGVPGHEELAMGAIASGGSVVFNESTISSLHIKQSTIEAIVRSEQSELLRREGRYRNNRPLPDIKGQTLILVDDGIATGATMKAAIRVLKAKKPAEIIVAVPVAERSGCVEMAGLIDKMICPLQPVDFYAVGCWYEDFTQTTDEEVIGLLEKLEQS